VCSSDLQETAAAVAAAAVAVAIELQPQTSVCAPAKGVNPT
jgi:hypothetical protein